MLERETAHFEGKLAEWLTSHRDEFVLIKGSEVLGFYHSVDDAHQEGARRLGLSPFMARKIEPHPRPVSVPALALGILFADEPLLERSTDDLVDRRREPRQS